MIRILSPYFVAGVVLRDGYVVRAADILHYMVGKRMSRVLAYSRNKGWKTEIL